MTETAAPRPKRGLLVVILLGVIFFALMSILIVTAGKKPAPPPPPMETLSVLPLRIRLRTEPNAQAPVVASATQGEKLIVIEDRGAWVRVQDPDGLSGWAERNSLERTSERERRLARYEVIRKLPPLSGLVRQRTQLYAGPGIFYPIVGELTPETQVRVYTRDHDFYAVEHDNGIAYADVDAIDVSAAGSKQLEVRTSEPSAPPTETTASAAPPPPEPINIPAPPPVTPVESEPVSRVYAAVPVGGTQPEELERVIPRYPTEARRAGVAGAVVIRGIVRRDGTIDNVEILKDLPYGLGEAAREAVSRWRFRPATYRGEPIDVYYTVTVNFRLR
jgi:TonB family protein